MIEILGWIGSILFAICAIPQAVLSYRQKHSNGLSSLMLWAWFIGEVLTLVYVYIDNFSLPLLFNYGANLLCLLVIIYYKYCPDKEYELKKLLAEYTQDYIKEEDYFNPLVKKKMTNKYKR